MNTCSVLVPAPDLSSYQIYVFSGVSDTPKADTRILDMYVLSIPVFSWTKIEMKNYPDQYGISNMACKFLISSFLAGTNFRLFF